jgi:hypothetical protein
MLFYLIVLYAAISLEWITNRKSISDLWLLDVINPCQLYAESRMFIR